MLQGLLNDISPRRSRGPSLPHRNPKYHLKGLNFIYRGLQSSTADS